MSVRTGDDADSHPYQIDPSSSGHRSVSCHLEGQASTSLHVAKVARHGQPCRLSIDALNSVFRRGGLLSVRSSSWAAVVNIYNSLHEPEADSAGSHSQILPAAVAVGPPEVLVEDAHYLNRQSAVLLEATDFPLHEYASERFHHIAGEVNDRGTIVVGTCIL